MQSKVKQHRYERRIVIRRSRICMILHNTYLPVALVLVHLYEHTLSNTFVSIRYNMLCTAR